MNPAESHRSVLVPLDEIDESALIRDRTGLDSEPLDELALSIATAGLRQPVEVFPIEPGSALASRARRDARFGLISGFRRLAVFRERAEAGDARYAAIPAFVRQPGSVAAALTAMVEENAMRTDISPYEQGLVAVAARDSGVFGTLDEAVETLYRNMTRTKRARLRSIARVADELGGALGSPEALSLRQILRIASALHRGFGPLICAALEETRRTDPESQWALIAPILAEAEAADPADEVARASRGGRPRRMVRLRANLTLRREMTRDGYILRFTGREATSALLDEVIDNIELMYSPAR